MAYQCFVCLLFHGLLIMPSVLAWKATECASWIALTLWWCYFIGMVNINNPDVIQMVNQGIMISGETNLECYIDLRQNYNHKWKRFCFSEYGGPYWFFYVYIRICHKIHIILVIREVLMCHNCLWFGYNVAHMCCITIPFTTLQYLCIIDMYLPTPNNMLAHTHVYTHTHTHT